MDAKEIYPKTSKDASPILKPHLLTGIITPGEVECEVLDMLEIAVESVDEGFEAEGTNAIIGEAQLRALRIRQRRTI